MHIAKLILERVCIAWNGKPFAGDVWQKLDGDELRQAINRQCADKCRITDAHDWALAERAGIRDHGIPLDHLQCYEDRWGELDAYYARLYGSNRNQLRYILDPHGLSEPELEDILDPWEDPTCSGPHLFPDELAEGFPGETSRVLNNNEEKEYGEYRSRRLVLEARGCTTKKSETLAYQNHGEQAGEG